MGIRDSVPRGGPAWAGVAGLHLPSYPHHLLPTAQRHSGTHGHLQLRVRGAPSSLHQQSRCLQPQQVVGLGAWRGRQGGGGDTGAHRCIPCPSAACVPSRFPKPPQPVLLRDCQVLPLPPGLPLTRSQELTPGAPPPGPQPRPPTAADPAAEPTLLRHPQVRAWPGLAASWAPCSSWCGLTGASPCRAPWFSPPMCPPWAATPSCCMATSPPTRPLLWRSSSMGAASGRVSRERGPLGERAVRGLVHTAHTGRG